MVAGLEALHEDFRYLTYRHYMELLRKRHREQALTCPRLFMMASKPKTNPLARARSNLFFNQTSEMHYLLEHRFQQ